VGYIQPGIADQDEMSQILVEMKGGDLRRSKEFLRGAVYYEVRDKLGAGPLKALEIASDLSLDAISIDVKVK
jgi:hypothetical protein